MKHIFIIGSRGYKANYGGFETFVTKLVDNYNDSNVIFHVSGLSNDKNILNNKINDNLISDSFNIKANGGLKMLLCTIKSFLFYIKYIKKNNINNCYIYVLGLKLGPLLKIYKNKLKRYGITVMVNPDGLEYKRSKWNNLVKKFFLLSEKWMLLNSDIIVCDAIGIKEYIDNKYLSLKDKTIYIAYGTDDFNFANVNEEEILKKYKIKKDSYFLMVGRFVPENNYELVINEFMKSKTDKRLIIISNISSSNYYNEVVSNTNCNKDKRIIFIDGIYNEIELSTIRKNAYAYIHGHSVGGTNPSLLEALNLTDLNILYDVNFNRDIGNDSCLYFKEDNSLTNIIDNINKYDRKKMGKSAKKIIKENFTWKIIVNKYKDVFKR
jgi:rhamnosyltransferase